MLSKDELSMFLFCLYKPCTNKIYFFRVSFGSSKGSMVETLIYDSPPVQEEPLDPNDIDDTDG